MYVNQQLCMYYDNSDKVTSYVRIDTYITTQQLLLVLIDIEISLSG